jgi:hypothetical protein
MDGRSQTGRLTSLAAFLVRQPTKTGPHGREATILEQASRLMMRRSLVSASRIPWVMNNDCGSFRFIRIVRATFT